MKTKFRIKSILILVLVVLLSSKSNIAQNVGIGAESFTPNANAMLDVESDTKGFLPPRLSLTETTNFAPLSAHVAGMVVYNTATANDVVPGLYVNDGSKWVALIPVIYTAGDGVEINNNVISTSGGGVVSNLQFTLSAHPSSVSIPTNNSNAASPISVTATYVSGSVEAISYTVTGVPAGVFSSLSPGNGTPNCVSTLVFQVSASAIPGTYPITITALGGATTQTASVNLTVQAPKHVFVTSVGIQGNMGGSGISGAHTHCQNLANAAGLQGTYKAWISSSTASPSTTFTQSTTPYVLLNNTVIAINWTDLTDGTLLNPININELGNNVGDLRVWTQTRGNGTWDDGNCSNTCSNWSVNTSASSGKWGRTGAFNQSWTRDGNSTGGTNVYDCGGTHECNHCNCSYRLYCFEQ